MFRWKRTGKTLGWLGRVPPIKLTHLKNLTDDTGIIQHAKYAVPDRRSGYTVDDNSRALIVIVKYCRLFGVDEESLRLANVYLSFIYHMQQEDGRVYNLMSYDRRIIDGYSEDCVGRVLWACGYTLDSPLSEDVKLLAKEVFDKALPHAFKMRSPRGIAYSILGLYHYARAFPEDPNVIRCLKTLADKLLEHYSRNSSPDWIWFEPYLTYDNPRIPYALSKAYEAIGDTRYLEAAVKTFKFLTYVETIDEVYAPIGNNGWYFKGRFRALYDQQPIEAGSMVEAAASLYKISGDREYLKTMWKAFNWFLGENINKTSVYDQDTGGCHDGLTPEGVNLNQGAEAVVCYLISRLELESLKRK
ncbi:glycosyltransferase [Candidatus Bathyarchaeota archaeon]|nr:glycosyltransferase [Candidatus Bathyarchaeota archaeon]